MGHQHPEPHPEQFRAHQAAAHRQDRHPGQTVQSSVLRARGCDAGVHLFRSLSAPQVSGPDGGRRRGEGLRGGETLVLLQTGIHGRGGQWFAGGRGVVQRPGTVQRPGETMRLLWPAQAGGIIYYRFETAGDQSPFGLCNMPTLLNAIREEAQ